MFNDDAERHLAELLKQTTCESGMLRRLVRDGSFMCDVITSIFSSTASLINV